MTSYSYSAESQFLDIEGPEFVEVTVKQDRGVLWINIDGRCAVRICQIKKLVGRIPRPKSDR
jgi:hypothetical protein